MPISGRELDMTGLVYHRFTREGGSWPWNMWPAWQAASIGSRVMDQRGSESRDVSRLKRAQTGDFKLQEIQSLRKVRFVALAPFFVCGGEAGAATGTCR